MKTIHRQIDQNKAKYLDLWFEALRIPSVSALPEHKGDMKKMAEWLADKLRNELGLDAQIFETIGNPLVYAESPKIPGKPTVLVYGHYDVQPADPLDQWQSEPFEPEIRDENVFCRGADDDKGQLLTHLFAARATLDAKGQLPVQLKFVLEGEEETGSAGLEHFLTDPKNRELLAADVILVSDTDMPGPGQPGITYGLRGVLGFELELTGPNRDLHSGLYGGSILNPAFELCRLLASVMDENGRIQIPGFYDDVLELTELDRKALAELPFDEKESHERIGVSGSFGESAYTILERRGARPSFDINGLTSGYQGQGGKTIIPSTASAKFTFRMVPNQDPNKIAESLRAYFQEWLLPQVTMKLTRTQASPGVVVPLDNPYVAAAARGLESSFGKKPLFVREGGAIPIVAELAGALSADLILAGFGLESDGIHSPNEHFSLASFFGGIHASAAILDEIGRGREARRPACA